MERILKTLETAKGHAVDILSNLYQNYILNGERPAAAFQTILQYTNYPIGSEEDDAPPTMMSQERLEEIKHNYYPILREMVKLLARQDLPPEDFYNRLYQQVFLSGILPANSDTAPVFLLLLAENTPEIPYYQSSGLVTMPNDEYQSIVKDISESLYQAAHMMHRNFASRTEEASQLLRIADGIKDRKSLIVYWSVVLSYCLRFKRPRRPKESMEDQ